MRALSLRKPGLRRAQRGLSIVEMMVGVAVGLIVVAAATIMVAAQLADNRRLLLETQVQQDLRATADIVSRDLRRAGYWGDAYRGTSSAGAGGIVVNPYRAVSPSASGATASTVTYEYANRNNPEDGVLTDDERLGFRLRSGVIETQLGLNNWQALTDAGALTVTVFNVTADKQQVVLACHRACSAGLTPCPPIQEVRGLTVDIAGRAVSDAAVQRSVRTHVRLRNDNIVGECRD
jgi:prepilin peptidase dependent protein B